MNTTTKKIAKLDINKPTAEWLAMTPEQHRESILRGTPGGWVANWGQFDPKNF